jgi:hypothetical protein
VWNGESFSHLANYILFSCSLHLIYNAEPRPTGSRNGLQSVQSYCKYLAIPFILHLPQLAIGYRVVLGLNMPPSKPKPSEIAAEAKKTYIPYIRQNYSSQWPAQSFLCHSESLVAQPPQVTRHCRFGTNCLDCSLSRC